MTLSVHIQNVWNWNSVIFHNFESLFCKNNSSWQYDWSTIVICKLKFVVIHTDIVYIKYVLFEIRTEWNYIFTITKVIHTKRTTQCIVLSRKWPWPWFCTLPLTFNHDKNIRNEFLESTLYRKVLSHITLGLLVQPFYLDQA